jgi:muramoyltetrapeptide carboxypeptidase
MKHQFSRRAFAAMMPHMQYAPGSVKPRPLPPGATIGLVAPSGGMPPEAVEAGVARMQALGYRTVLGAHACERHGYLAGTDAQRAADFNAIWSDPAVDGVVCLRGGYGAMRILECIDWDAVRAKPKWFCGFSDITALHLAMEKEAGLVTFHGPMAAAFGNEEYDRPGFLQAMQCAEPLGEIAWPDLAMEGAPEPLVVREGVAEGRLIGGNLSLLAAMAGTPWEPDYTGRIVLIEDIDEPPYRMDRMLLQLLLSNNLSRAAGILFGDSPTCWNGEEGRPSLTLPDVLNELLAPLGIPVLYGFPCGHTQFRATIPLGVQARLDAGAASLTILEPAVQQG